MSVTHIFDFYLRNLEGHYAHYDLELAAALRVQGGECRVWGSLQADPSFCSQCGVVPELPEVSELAALCTRRPWMGLWYFTESRRFRRVIRDILLREDVFKPGDTIFLPTVFAFDFHEFCHAVKSIAPELNRRRLRWVIMLRFEVLRPVWWMDLLFRHLHAAGFAMLKKAGLPIRYVTDTEALAADYRRCFGLEMEVVPIPVRNSPVPRVSHAKGSLLTVSFLGAARMNKGFDLFVQLLERLSADPELFRRLEFDVQAYLQPRVQTASDIQRIEPFVQRLAKLAAAHPNIRMYREALTSEEYDQALARADIAVLAYRPTAFRSASSNVLPESVCNSIIPLVGDGTWLADELKREGFGELVFTAENLDALELLFRKTVASYDDIRKRLDPLAQRWRAFHNADNLAQCLTDIWSKK